MNKSNSTGKPSVNAAAVSVFKKRIETLGKGKLIIKKDILNNI